MRKYNLIFIGEEYNFRLGIYLTQKRFIEEFNSEKKSFFLGENNLIHLTPSEYKSLLGAKFNGKFISSTKPSYLTAPPKSIDWREKGIVNPVKDQGPCGSCWAFSVIQAQESQWAKEHNELHSLSESNLVDCCTSCAGCDGGWPNDAFDYIISKQKGMFMNDSDYPYSPRSQKCQFNIEKGITNVKSYFISELGNEADLMNNIANHGVGSVCIDASLDTFHLYSSGIYDDQLCSQWSLDHAVGLVGYGIENNKQFWIIRNSWGSNWGENGYMRMIKGKLMCGIAMMAVFPTVSK